METCRQQAANIITNLGTKHWFWNCYKTPGEKSYSLGPANQHLPINVKLLFFNLQNYWFCRKKTSLDRVSVFISEHSQNYPRGSLEVRQKLLKAKLTFLYIVSQWIRF